MEEDISYFYTDDLFFDYDILSFDDSSISSTPFSEESSESDITLNNPKPISKPKRRPKKLKFTPEKFIEFDPSNPPVFQRKKRVCGKPTPFQNKENIRKWNEILNELKDENKKKKLIEYLKKQGIFEPKLILYTCPKDPEAAKPCNIKSKHQHYLERLYYNKNRLFCAYKFLGLEY